MKKEKKTMVTQKELADELKISVATVSLALSGSPLVNKETAKLRCMCWKRSIFLDLQHKVS